MGLGEDDRITAELQVSEIARPAAPVRVLLVDDDDAVRAALLRMLRRANTVVEEFASGFRALARLRETSYDVALLDLSMADIEGEELACALLEKAPNIRILFISGESDCERGHRVRSMGATVFGKPWDSAEVIEAVMNSPRVLPELKRG
jgi:FixJ family two-component response regulator